MIYTPTTEQVRDTWNDQMCIDLNGDHSEGCSSGKDFDRWLDSVLEKVWDEGYSVGSQDGSIIGVGRSANPYKEQK